MTDIRPTVFLLHGLGLSGRLYDAVVAELGEGYDCVPVDLPGFGSAAGDPRLSVEGMADAVVEVVARRAGPRWLLVGQSMGGKVASVVAARTLSGVAPLFGLAGVVLLAASPPSPEPIDEDKRAEMLGWAAADALGDDAARAYVDGNVTRALPPELDALALADVRRSAPDAWTAWLTQGSHEDWSDVVGVLDLPAVVLAGADDGPLGPEGQRRLHGPVYPRASYAVLDGVRHLLPLECPTEVAAAIADLWTGVAGRGPTPSPSYAALLASGRVSTRTRAALAARAVADDPAYVPTVMSTDQLTTLRALADRVVPQPGGPEEAVDLAARVEAALARGDSDGWRFADLPADPDAYRTGLDVLADLAGLTAEEQDARLAEVAAGRVDPEGSGWTAEQLAHWFQDARVDLVRAWLAHPATLERIGYDGMATGGDLVGAGARLTGFQILTAGHRDAWEPTA